MYLAYLWLSHRIKTKLEDRQLAKIFNRVLDAAGSPSAADNHNYMMLHRWTMGMRRGRMNEIMRSGKHTKK